MVRLVTFSVSEYTALPVADVAHPVKVYPVREKPFAVSAFAASYAWLLDAVLPTPPFALYATV